jgi:PAS domain S-box-containing protein
VEESPHCRRPSACRGEIGIILPNKLGLGICYQLGYSLILAITGFEAYTPRSTSEQHSSAPVAYASLRVEEAMEGGAHTPMPDTQIFRDVFNASPIGIAVENLDGQPLFVNPAFCSMLGFSAEELCSKHCVDFSPPEDAEKDWALFKQLRAGSIDHYQLEKRYFRRDGSLVWGNLSISLLKGGSSPLVLAMVQDITDKKRAEEARFRNAAIVESCEDAVASVTLGGVIESWNRGAQRIFGYTESEVVGKPVDILVPPERPAEENQILETLKAGGRIDQFETVRVTKTGERINVSLSISPIKDSTGKIVGFSGISRDITERKRAEAALRESEERLRLAAQAGRMFAYSWDASSDLIERSGQSSEILGVEKGEVATGAAVSAMIHSDDRQRVESALAKLTTNNPTLQITYRIIRLDGSIIWLERNCRAYFDEQGKVRRIVGMIVDVTERKFAEDRLREYEKAVEGSGEMICVVDREYRYLIANRQFLDMRNTTRERVVGHFAHEVLNKDVFEAAIKPRLDECFQGKVVKYELKYTYPALGERDLLVSYFPIEGTGGIDRIVCILQDITDRKRAEEALSGMTRRLIESQEQERTRIGRELHDDINQRLAMLAIELERLQSNPLEVRSRLQQLREETIAISSDVQALSHELHSSKLEYLGVVSGMKSWCKEFSERQKVEVDFRSDVSSPLSFEIGLSLFRVLQEALHNAVKHSGVKRVEVQVAEYSNEFHLIVKDLGCGFDLEAAKRGRGLGLTSMQERLKLVSGQLYIESKSQEGTTIHARVPLSPKVKSAGTGLVETPDGDLRSGDASKARLTPANR